MKKYHPEVDRLALILLILSLPLILYYVVGNLDAKSEVISFYTVFALFYLCIRASYLEVRNDKELIIQWWLIRKKIEIKNIHKIWNKPVENYFDVYSAYMYVEYTKNNKNKYKAISAHWFSNKDLEELLARLKQINPNIDAKFIPNKPIKWI